MARKIAGLALWFCIVGPALAAAAEPVRFSLTSDNLDHKGFVDVLAQMQTVPGGPGAFMVLVGDFHPAAATRRQLDQVLGKDFAWYPVIGNHEKPSSAKEAKKPKTAPAAAGGAPAAPRPATDIDYLHGFYEEHLKGKVNPGPEGTRETTYSFDVGEVHVAAINQYWTGEAAPGHDARGEGGVVPALSDWLRRDLAATRKPWKIVVGHEPAFPRPDQNWGGDGRHEKSSLNANRAERDAFWKVMEEQGVAIYFCGHTHRYSRYRPPGSKVWQIDVAQARGSKSTWKFDAFVLVTADAASLRLETYRNLKEQGRFDVTDSLILKSGSAPPVVAPSAKPATK